MKRMNPHLTNKGSMFYPIARGKFLFLILSTCL
jgi:hypothetical protein